MNLLTEELRVTSASASRRRPGEGNVYLQLFVYLQVLDFLTTLVGFKLGIAEASPAIRWMTQLGTTAGLALSKFVALVLAGVCIWLNKHHLVRWINYWYAALIIWNLSVILVTPRLV